MPAFALRHCVNSEVSLCCVHIISRPLKSAPVLAVSKQVHHGQVYLRQQMLYLLQLAYICLLLCRLATFTPIPAEGSTCQLAAHTTFHGKV